MALFMVAVTYVFLSISAAFCCQDIHVFYWQESFCLLTLPRLKSRILILLYFQNFKNEIALPFMVNKVVNAW